MKRLVHSLLVALVLGLVVGQPASATIPSRGDVTNDGRINAADALLILQFDAGLIDSLPP